MREKNSRNFLNILFIEFREVWRNFLSQMELPETKLLETWIS